MKDNDILTFEVYGEFRPAPNNATSLRCEGTAGWTAREGRDRAGKSAKYILQAEP